MRNNGIFVALVFFILLFCQTMLTGETSGEASAESRLKPGETAVVTDLLGIEAARGVVVKEIRDGAVRIRWLSFQPGAGIREEPLNGDRVIVIWEGTAEQQMNGIETVMSDKKCMYLDDGMEYSIRTGEESAEIIEVTWPGGRVDTGGQEVTLAEEMNHSAARLTKPSFPPGAVFGYYEPQFSRPVKNLSARVVQGKRGQVCFVRMDADAAIQHDGYSGEHFLIVTRGWMENTVNGKTSRIESGEVACLDGSSVSEIKTGPRGCDAIAVFSPLNPVYAGAAEKRLALFQTIIPPGTRPKLLIDGTKDEPGLTFTEGPSWMDGKFYFSNYYKFWKPWGSSDEGGLWAVYPDDTHEVLNKNVQTCGTTPLPNGNLAVCDLFKHGVVEMAPDGTVGRTIVDSYDGIPLGVANDVTTDRKGGLYITDSSVSKEGEKQPGTALYYFSAGGEMTRVTEPNDVVYINGVVVSPDDKRLFLNGSGEIYVWMFDISDDGTLSNKRPFVRLLAPDNQLGRDKPFSTADGMAIDREENLYVATALGIQVFDKIGGFIGIISFPNTPSHCVFGGDDLSTLYVTARTHIYSIKTGKTGFRYPLR